MKYKVDYWLPGAGEKGKPGVTDKRKDCLFGDDEILLELDSRDVCTIL